METPRRGVLFFIYLNMHLILLNIPRDINSLNFFDVEIFGNRYVMMQIVD